MSDINVSGMRVVDLQAELKSRGLESGGKKAELQARLKMALSSKYAQCLAHLQQGAALVVAVFMSWFVVHKEGEWIKEKDLYGNTLLHCALKTKTPEAVVTALLAAWPDAAKEKDNTYGKTPLHLALEYNVAKAVAVALIAAWPDAAKEKNDNGNTALHNALQFRAPEAVAMVLLAAWPDAVKEKTNAGNTPLHVALMNSAPEAVVTALLAAWPDAIKERNKYGETKLHVALINSATEITTHWNINQPTGGGDTVLHTLVATECSSVAEARNSNSICFTLVEKRASLTATNALGQTPAEASRADTVPSRLRLHGGP